MIKETFKLAAAIATAVATGGLDMAKIIESMGTTA